MSAIELAEMVPQMAPQEDARRARILDGAAAAFLAYGFRRTTMEDIARAAEISRPALYLLFRNKTDIYRALASEFLAKFLSGAEAALAGDGALEERLERAVLGSFDMMAEIAKSPHGADILDMKESLAADVVADGRTRMEALFEAAIAQEAARLGQREGLPEGQGDGEPSPARLAAFILDALDGLNLRNPPPEERRETACCYIRLAVAAMGRFLAGSCSIGRSSRHPPTASSR